MNAPHRRLLSPLLMTLLAATVSGCGEDAPKQPADNTTGGGDADAAMSSEEEHGERHDLGKLMAFGVSFQVVQYGDVHAGEEAAFELEFAAAEQRIGTVRGWVGIENGRGSMKSLWALEGDLHVHGHVEVPKEIPEGAKLWIELEKGEDSVRHSVAYQ